MFSTAGFLQDFKLLCKRFRRSDKVRVFADQVFCSRFRRHRDFVDRCAKHRLPERLWKPQAAKPFAFTFDPHWSCEVKALQLLQEERLEVLLRWLVSVRFISKKTAAVSPAFLQIQHLLSQSGKVPKQA